METENNTTEIKKVEKENKLFTSLYNYPISKRNKIIMIVIIVVCLALSVFFISKCLF
jgi:cell division protein FtsL